MSELKLGNSYYCKGQNACKIGLIKNERPRIIKKRQNTGKIGSKEWATSSWGPRDILKRKKAGKIGSTKKRGLMLWQIEKKLSLLTNSYFVKKGQIRDKLKLRWGTEVRPPSSRQDVLEKLGVARTQGRSQSQWICILRNLGCKSPPWVSKNLALTKYRENKDCAFHNIFAI